MKQLKDPGNLSAESVPFNHCSYAFGPELLSAGEILILVKTNMELVLAQSWFPSTVLASPLTWAGYLILQRLCFLIWKMGTVIPLSYDCGGN